MAISIISPVNSFVQFDNPETISSCNYRDIDLCLPVYLADDVNFQFAIQADDIEGIDNLCFLLGEFFTVGIVRECGDEYLLQLPGNFERFRLSDYQLLFNWQNGLTGFDSVIGVGECFLIKVTIAESSFCSNCFQRIGSDCHTSVIEYSNEDNAFGFSYCNSEAIGSDAVTDCTPTFITFTNQSTLAIPYTAAMIAKYGNIPTLKVWIYDGAGVLVNMSVSQTLDAYPPTQINIDFGGPATGVLKIS